MEPYILSPLTLVLSRLGRGEKYYYADFHNQALVLQAANELIVGQVSLFEYRPQGLFRKSSVMNWQGNPQIGPALMEQPSVASALMMYIEASLEQHTQYVACFQ